MAVPGRRRGAKSVLVLLLCKRQDIIAEPAAWWPVVRLTLGLPEARAPTSSRSRRPSIG